MKLGSLLTAMITPFREDLSLNAEQAARLARYLVDIGNEGVVVAGTTGESATLTDEEKLELFRAVVREIGGRATVIAGTGTNDTRHSIELTKEAEKLGVDAIMAVVPYYNRPTQEGLYRHFRAIAESTSLPVMLYNVPSRTGCNLLPETVARLAEIDNIVAIKEASGDLNQVSEIRRRTPPDFAIYSGDDSLTLPILALGGVGVVSVAAHLVGRRLRAMIDAFQKGDVRTATAIHLELWPIFRAMFITTNPIPVKTAINMLGMNAGPLRPPLGPPSEDEERAIRQVLRENGLLN
ncbi:MAG: 4-hydroxy-tetrahydrodipicolinate synthase [Limnochordales bacterium]|jgi:dihydrodipicolinate synthase|nr:4-hydroxy-tetrahydrodipicolinate synthase [Bacillota bacterium]